MNAQKAHNITKSSDAKNQGLPVMVLLALLVAGLLCSEFHGIWKDFWLERDAKQTTATIVSEGLKPGSFYYQYVVEGIAYTGSGGSGGNMGENPRVGDKVLICYSSSHPAISSPNTPNFSPLLSLVIVAVLLALEFLILRMVINLRRNSENRKAG